MDLQRISGLSFFGDLPKNKFYLEKDFVTLDRSIIWQFNDFFWENISLWEKTFGEHYESSLPSGLSESHKDAFIQKSARRFFDLLITLDSQKKLPEKIVVLEQGPGTGIYARGFLQLIKDWSERRNIFWERFKFVFSDTSTDILTKLEKDFTDFSGKLEFFWQKDMFDAPTKYKDQVLLVRHGNLWDQLPCRLVRYQNSQWQELLVRAVSGVSISGDPLEYLKSNLKIWKEFYRGVKLEEKWVDLMINLPFVPDSTELVLSSRVVENIDSLNPLVDWENGGYMEVVDLIVPEISGFVGKDRRPKKYDGGIAVAINGPMVQEFLKTKNLKMDLERITEKKINMIATIRQLP